MGSSQFQFKKSLLASSVATACFVSSVAANAQEPVEEEVIVSGIRASLQRAMDVKRESKGVVDAISAEDIGKFPATNLAESLQRIPGVSINRVNGEGSQITVRGFGPNFNTITVNGRTMPTADANIIGANNQAPTGTGRGFDFSNMAADGIQALEVYKTGRADAASGGIGASVNVVTREPLDADGLEASVRAKAVVDTTVDTGDEITPELSGLINWSSDDGKFGVGFSGNYSKRDSAAPGASSQQWNTIPYSQFLSQPDGATATIVNPPSDGNTLITTPFDSRYHFSEYSSERVNGHLVAQFAPTETIKLTADYMVTSNEQEEKRYDISNWFGRSFTDVTFDSSPVPTTVFVSEVATNKSVAMEQQFRSTKDELESLGFNAELALSDTFTLEFDVHSSKSEVSPNAPMGFSEINVGVEMFASPEGDNSTISHGVDYSGEVPVMQIIHANTATAAALTSDELARRAVDPAQAGSSIANELLQITQTNEIDQFELKGSLDFSDTSELVFGLNHRVQENFSDRKEYQQVLGNWGGENRGDIEAVAPGSLEVFSMSDRFDATIGGVTLEGEPVNGNVYGLRGNASEIFPLISAAYDRPEGYDGILGTADDGARSLGQNVNNVDTIKETVTAIFAQYSTEFDIKGLPVSLNVGARYEDTEVESSSASLPTVGINWLGNNDFTRVVSSDSAGLSGESSYDNFLPNIDVTVNATDDLVVRASYSKTIARATYNNLFVSGNVGTPNAPIALGGAASANFGQPALLPLESDNFDISTEWYYDDDSYVSVGYFYKTVSNFVGQQTTSEPLFNIPDVTSGADGTESGDALALLDELGAVRNQDNFFAATALIQANGIDAARTELTGLLQPDGTLTTGVNGDYDQIENQYDVVSDGTEPSLIYSVARPVNNEDATIDGFELQGQHFFGDTGFGISASYTIVEGDISFDDTSLGDGAGQFALVGLSDTANITLIYENYGFSGRIAYNWRDDFLNTANDGSSSVDPIYFEEYSQIDASLSYDVNENFSLSLDAINLTEEATRSYQRSTSAMQFYRENGARYYFGARYKF